MLSSPPALAFASEGEGFRWMKSLRPFSPPGKIEVELKKQSSCSLELINKTDQYLTFKLSDNQAQKMFGNRWTEIAKVVSGRTDNAVKNRFSTLCKKRAKFEASSKENSVPSLDPSNKRVLVEEPSIAILIGEPSTSNKQMG
ncbi:hypothetical protein ZIOFF_044776 [Zingiber officinale]|uniref:HTH myb-type domain-containing protein n=1 Tax=Zingiber officinale TaxID=94328 RepID=A0A8J5L0F5_ZINOF|nr:hypothetical protein ZIOFF_044776 [Zingiber officinale]